MQTKMAWSNMWVEIYFNLHTSRFHETLNSELDISLPTSIPPSLCPSPSPFLPPSPSISPSISLSSSSDLRHQVHHWQSHSQHKLWGPGLSGQWLHLWARQLWQLPPLFLNHTSSRYSSHMIGCLKSDCVTFLYIEDLIVWPIFKCCIWLDKEVVNSGPYRVYVQWLNFLDERQQGTFSAIPSTWPAHQSVTVEGYVWWGCILKCFVLSCFFLLICYPYISLHF